MELLREELADFKLAFSQQQPHVRDLSDELQHGITMKYTLFSLRNQIILVSIATTSVIALTLVIFNIFVINKNSGNQQVTTGNQSPTIAPSQGSIEIKYENSESLKVKANDRKITNNHLTATLSNKQRQHGMTANNPAYQISADADRALEEARYEDACVLYANANRLLINEINTIEQDALNKNSKSNAENLQRQAHKIRSEYLKARINERKKSIWSDAEKTLTDADKLLNEKNYSQAVLKYLEYLGFGSSLSQP